MGFKEDIKVNIFRRYEKEVQEIVERYGYSLKISTILKILVPVFIEYYGEEYKDIIIDTLRETRIIKRQNGETIYDIINENSDPNIETTGLSTVSDGDLKRASGVCSSNPIITMDKSGQFTLQGQRRIVVYSEYANRELEGLATLVHELGHAIKSSRNEYKLEQSEDGEQLLISRNGLIQTKSKIYMRDGKIIIEGVEDKNVGLEEGINSYDEERIVNRILQYRGLPKDMLPEDCWEYLDRLRLPDENNQYQPIGYLLQKEIAKKLMGEIELKNHIRIAQIADCADIESIYNSEFSDGENHWRKLNKHMDKSVEFTYHKFAHIFNLEKWIKENGKKEEENIEAIMIEIGTYRKKANLPKKQQEL